MASESEEEKVMSKIKRKQRAVVDESQDDDAQMEEEEDAYRVQVPAKKLKGDEDYDLLNQAVQLEEDMIQHPKSCHFC